jgi:hypothetical protein
MVIQLLLCIYKVLLCKTAQYLSCIVVYLSL